MASRASTKSKAAKPARAAKAGKAAAKKPVKKPVKKVSAAPKASAKPSARPSAKANTKKASTPSKLLARATALAKGGLKKLKSVASKATQPKPPRYHTVTPFLNVKAAVDAIDFYKKAFGAEERLRMPNADGSIMHAELTIGDSTIMLSDASNMPESRSAIHLTVTDCDEIFERAVAAGGTERMPPQDMFWGDRYGQVEDPFGNVWSISTPKEEVSPEELARRASQATAAAETPPAPPAASSSPEVTVD